MENKLELMFEQQKEFMDKLVAKGKFPHFPFNLKSKIGQQAVDGIIYHTIKELIESSQTLANAKQHRSTEINEFDHEHYLEELIDAQHLLYEIIISSGISIEQFFNAYIKKGLINEERLKNGY